GPEESEQTVEGGHSCAVNDYFTATPRRPVYAGPMSSEARRPSRPAPPAGLCDTCRHQREVRNTRGSSFSLCARSRQDPAYPRYPRLPVWTCPGYGAREDRGAWARPPRQPATAPAAPGSPAVAGCSETTKSRPRTSASASAEPASAIAAAMMRMVVNAPVKPV